MSSPGALLHRPAASLSETPFYRPPVDVVPRDNFTAVILCQQGVLPPLYRLLKQVDFTAVILCQQGVLPPLYRLLKQVDLTAAALPASKTGRLDRRRSTGF